MVRWMQALGGIVGAAILMCALGALAQDQQWQPPTDAVFAYRADVMKGIGTHASALGAIMQKRLPYERNVALHAQAIALGAKAALKAFETRQASGTAKPEIWDNWKDFSDRLIGLADDADVLAKKASAGPVTEQEVMGVLLACKSCHDTYRFKK